MSRSSSVFRAQDVARTPQNLETARKSLLEAVERGRTRAYRPVVVPAADRKTSPTANGVVAEEWDLCSERDHPQGWVPLCIVRKQDSGSDAAPIKRPAVIFLHPTCGSKELVRGRQEEYAALGYVTAAIDCRYHGQRAGGKLGLAAHAVYEEALVRAWHGADERPFLLDNVWDIMHVVDYLVRRPDVDPERVGVTGFSLGGMHAWLVAAADPRIAVVAPVGGVQSFTWAVANNSWQGRAAGIPQVFAAAARDMDKPEADAEVVLAVWKRLLPGLIKGYDAPYSLPCITPRPLLVCTGQLDAKCPLKGVLRACKVTKATYTKTVEQERLATRRAQEVQEARELLTHGEDTEATLLQHPPVLDGLEVGQQDDEVDDDDDDEASDTDGEEGPVQLPVPVDVQAFEVGVEPAAAEAGGTCTQEAGADTGEAATVATNKQAIEPDLASGDLPGLRGSMDDDLKAVTDTEVALERTGQGSTQKESAQPTVRQTAAPSSNETEAAQPEAGKQLLPAGAAVQSKQAQGVSGKASAAAGGTRMAKEAVGGAEAVVLEEVDEKLRPVYEVLDELLDEVMAHEAERAAAAAAAKEARRQAKEAAAREKQEVEEVVAKRFVVFVEPGVGHQETPAMNRAVLDFFNGHLLFPVPQSLSPALQKHIAM